jgi:hypothetical protein
MQQQIYMIQMVGNDCSGALGTCGGQHDATPQKLKQQHTDLQRSIIGPACYLCLSTACRTDHQDVLGHYFLRHRWVECMTSPSVPQGDGHGFLCFMLPNNEIV